MAKKQRDNQITELIDCTDLTDYVNRLAPLGRDGRPLYCISQSVAYRTAEANRFAPAFKYGDIRLWDISERDAIRGALDKAMRSDLASFGQTRTAPAAATL